MTDDAPQGTAHSLEMTAVVIGSSFRINPRTNDAKYRLTFSYPAGYDEYLKQIADGGAADMYWESEMIAQSARIVSLSMKPQKYPDEPIYTVVFELDPGDATRFNFNGAAAANATGTLRLVSTQLALFSN